MPHWKVAHFRDCSMKQRIYSPIFLSIFFLILIDTASPPAIMWTADLQITVHSPKVPKISFSGKFYQSGLHVRFEPSGSEEINLFDFERSVGFRIFPSDRIYFEKPLTRTRILKAVKEGWIPPAPPHLEKRVFLRKETIKEMKARLYLIIIETKGKKTYSLRWETADEAAIPLKVIYPGTGYETIIIDYNHIEVKAIDPDTFQPPADYLNLNPF
ncbi:MAG: hypothetical protein ACE5J1_06850 [Nitrospiria bacterium]